MCRRRNRGHLVERIFGKNKMIETLTWVLPRPSKSKYQGSFPLHFEKKLIRGLGISEDDKNNIFHPFGGKAEFGLRNDLNPAVKSDFMLDAHNLVGIGDNSFDLVIVDPPYNDDYSVKLYNQKGLKYKKYISEAVRVSRKYIASYHWVSTPRPEGTRFIKRIVVITRAWHRPRVCNVFIKEYLKESEGK
jgi:hypothetical protein